jgi:hypothetical protein
LARSLANDLRDAVDQARSGGHPPGRAVRVGLRGVADQVGKDLRAGLGGPRHRRSRDFYPGHWWWGRPPWAPPPPPPGAPGPSTGAPADGAPPWPGSGGGAAQPWAGYPYRPARPARPRRPPVRRRWDASTVLGLLAVLFGTAWLLGAVHAVHVSVEAVVAIGLMLLGASLIVTGRTDWSLSRKSWPVWMGAGMIAVLVATSSTFGIGGALHDISFGNNTVTATSARTVHGGFGDLTVDASSMTNGTLDVESVAGQVLVKLEQQIPVIVNARVLAGQICVDGKAVSSGVGASVNQTFGKQPAITVDVHEVFGQVVIGTPGCSR